MDPASLVGLVLTLVGIFVGLFLKGADPVALFTNAPALLIVVLGSIGAVWMSHTQKENVAALRSLKKVFVPGPRPDVSATIESLVTYAKAVRSEGLVALEKRLDGEQDPFLKRSLLLAVDGVDPEVMERTLRRDISAMSDRHKANANWFQTAGVFAPTLGIIGAVIGLIAVLGDLEDMEKLGHGIAAAFIATFWGVFLANGLFLPWSNKLKRRSAEEIAHRKLILEGALAIQAGTTPTLMVGALESALPIGERQAS